MPGFFLVKVFSKKDRFGFKYSMLSLFWGICLLIFYYKVMPFDKFSLLIQNPLAGAIVFSVLSVILGLVIKMFIGFLKKITSGIR